MINTEPILIGGFGWENKLELYQRLIEPPRIAKIRGFIAKEKKAFINNIVVSLPNTVNFYQNGDPTPINIFSIDEIQNITVKIPLAYNSIEIIDGQHRLYAHYETE